MKRNPLLELVENEIRSSEVIIESRKESIISQIKNKLKSKSNTTWFDIKMILFRNRYDNVDKDKFFGWLETTHLLDLCK